MSVSLARQTLTHLLTCTNLFTRSLIYSLAQLFTGSVIYFLLTHSFTSTHLLAHSQGGLTDEWLSEAQEFAARSCWGAKGLSTTHEEEGLEEEDEEWQEACCSCCSVEHHEEVVDDDSQPQPLTFSRADEVERVLLGCSAVLGMHPDQVNPDTCC